MTNSPAMTAIEPPTRRNAEVADILNTILADSFALYVKTKNFHWHVSGPHFRDYHLLFDAQAAQILGTTDAIAERVRKTGHTTLRSIGEIARRQSVLDSNDQSLTANQMLSELTHDNESLVDALRTAKALADEALDNATSAVIDEWTDAAEERVWMLRETGSRQ